MDSQKPPTPNLTGPIQLPASGSTEPKSYADEVVETGYSLIEGLYSPSEVEAIRDELTALYDVAGRPPLSTEKTEFFAPNIRIESIGASFYSIAQRRPRLARYRMKPFLFQVLKHLLGDDFVLDTTLCQLSDTSRPVGEWHNHLGGLDQTLYEELFDADRLAAIDIPRRLNVFVYLNDIAPGGGQLRLYPRVVNPLDAPFPETQEHWEGQVTPTFSKGTVLLLDQATWHTATPRIQPGMRMIFGLFVSERRAPHRLWSEGYAGPEGLVLEHVAPTHPGMSPAVGTVPTALPEHVTEGARRHLASHFPDWRWVATRADGEHVFIFLRSASGRSFIVTAGPEPGFGSPIARTPGVAWDFLADALPSVEQEDLFRIIPMLHEAVAPTVTGRPSPFVSIADVSVVRTGDTGEAASTPPELLPEAFRKAVHALQFPGLRVASVFRQAQQVLLRLEPESSVDERLEPTAVDGEQDKAHLTIEIEMANAEKPSFRELEGVAYSHRGDLKPDRLTELPRILEHLHACIGSRFRDLLS